MFGQWAWGGKGIKPEQQRADKGNYGVAAFESPQESVDSYMLNLGIHTQYAELRRVRAELREQGRPVSGYALTSTLLGYSEKGQAYVDELNALIRRNKLDEIDEARLGDAPAVILVAVGEGADQS